MLLWLVLERYESDMYVILYGILNPILVIDAIWSYKKDASYLKNDWNPGR